MTRRARKRCPIQPETLVIGVDIAKDKHLPLASGGDGSERRGRAFSNSAAGFQQLLEFADETVKRFKASDFVVALEPTGHYGQPLMSWLHQHGVPVYQVQPLHTSRLKELYDGTRRKTDAKDAGLIAEICRQGRGRPYRALEGPFAELHVLCRQRQALVKRRGQTKNRLHRHLDVVFPELRHLFPKGLSASCLWVLRHVPTPAQVLALGVDGLMAGLREASRGQLGRQRAEALMEAAKLSVGVTSALGAHRLAIGQLLDQLDDEMKQLEVVEREMARQLDQVPYAPRLLTIPQVGVVTVATLLGELGDLRGYRVAQQLIAMAGLDLVETSSGKRQGKRRISRRGRAYARQILYLAALRLGKRVLAAPRQRMEARNKPAAQAAVANMCRLLRILHALVRDDVDFDASRLPSGEAEAA